MLYVFDNCSDGNGVKSVYTFLNKTGSNMRSSNMMKGQNLLNIWKHGTS